MTGAGGRLGSALVAALTRRAPLARVVSVEGWSRPALELDRPETLGALVRARRPDLVIHAAAWTDVDGCAREPEVAMRRNGEATATLAEACRDGRRGPPVRLDQRGVRRPADGRAPLRRGRPGRSGEPIRRQQAGR